MAAQSAAQFGKPVAPFTLAAEAVATPAVGVPVDVRITVETRAELEDIEVRISVDEGLSLDVADYTLYAPSATPAQPAEWLISVVPVADGAHRLRLFGEALVGGARQGRSAVATLRVGETSEPGGETSESGAETTESGAETTESGRETSGPDSETPEPGAERVIRLPATVRP